jgi:hypothetical protein
MLYICGMHKRILFFFLFLISASLAWYSSCVKDGCKDVVCHNGGVCVNGACACPVGFEGTNCERKWNEKFTGIWNVADSIYKDNITRFHYKVSISDGLTKDSFYVLGITDTLKDSLVLCVRNSPRGFTMMEKKLNSYVAIVSGSGIMDSITGVVYGKYAYKRNDTTVTVGFTWRK